MSTAQTTLLAEVRLLLGSPSTTIIADATITRQLNYSYYELSTRYRHPEIEATATITTVDGTQAYATPTRYWYTQTMRDETNSRVLLWKPINWIVAQDTDTKGAPQYYTRQAATLLIYPTPDAVYSITHYHIARPLELAGAGTTAFDGLEWDEITVWGAVWRCHQIIEQNDQMVHSRNIWRTLVGSLPESEVMESERSFQAIPVTGGSPIPGNFSGPTA